MRVGEGLMAIVSIIAVMETQFQHLVELLEQRNGLVNRGQAGGWKLGLHFLINLINAGVVFAGCKDSQHSKALGCYAKIAIFQLGNHLGHAIFRCQVAFILAHPFVNRLMENRYLKKIFIILVTHPQPLVKGALFRP
jgi:hypothetical protein